MIILVGIGICTSCDREEASREQADKQGKQIFSVEEIVVSEEAVLQLTPLLKKIAEQMCRSSMGTQVAIPASGIKVVGAPEIQLPEAVALTQGQWHTWPLGEEPQKYSRIPYSSILTNWTVASFGILEGRFDRVDKKTFKMLCKFEGRGLEKERVIAVRALQNVLWEKQGEEWVIVHWQQESLEVSLLDKFLFTEVLDQAVDEEDVRNKLRRSKHEEMLIAAMTSGKMEFSNPKQAELPDIQSNEQYPCVSVVDVDNDGLDDLFVSSRIGGVQLLRNEGGGKLKDITRQSGLSLVNGFVNSAVFADFDNDGDQDLFLGRSLEESVYFINESGYFRDKTIQKLGFSEIYFVTSASATDINGDGLLDLYLCTYAPAGDANPAWFERYYSYKDRREIMAHTKNSHRYLNLAGPPNIVLMNRGDGKLEKIDTPSPLRAFRSSFQSIWADIDNDGDADCYLCNDFAPDQFYRNDTPRGAAEPNFVEIGDQVFPEEGMMGFGMGASWGDYDNDGDLDVYISNMYSKAGKRIIAMSGEVDERIHLSAKGNFLYENNGGKFKQVAGRGGGKIPVDQVGWSFAGQFADFDNDGKLDLYVPSGYYSAPDSVATELDL